MSYPNPYGGSAGNVPSYPSGPGGGYGGGGPPAPGFNTSGGGGGGFYPQQPGGGSPYPPQQQQGPGGGGAPGYPPQQPGGGGYPPSSGYPPQQPGGAYGGQQPPLSYPSSQPAAGGYGGQPPAGGQYPGAGGGQQYPGHTGGGPSYPQGGGGQHYGGAGGQQAPGGGGGIPTLSYGGGSAPPAQGYGSPAQGYGSPAPQGYGSPAPQGYGAPSPGYGGAPASAGYGGAPAPGYGSPAPQGYGSPASGYGSPAQGYGAGGGGGGGYQAHNVGYSTGASTAGTTPIMATHYQGTVKPSPTFNPNSDCETLKKAMKGLGCDEKTVVNVLCYRSNAQRQQIRNMFKTMYGKDLIKELISELRGNFEDLIVALMYTPGEYDARELNYAMAGVGTNESTLIEIMSTRTNSEIRDTRMAYKMMFGKDLERALVDETSGYFKRLLVSLCNAGRDESSNVDPARARKSAQDLHSAGVKRWGTDEATFNAVLCSQSHAQLQAVFEEYRKLAGHDIEQAIKAEFSGDVEDGLLAVVKSAKNSGAYFAERCYKSMVGMGTHDRCLIRAVVTRCEKDMVQIKQEFQRMYGKTLESFISGDCSGKYKEGLMALVRGN